MDCAGVQGRDVVMEGLQRELCHLVLYHRGCTNVPCRRSEGRASYKADRWLSSSAPSGQRWSSAEHAVQGMPAGRIAGLQHRRLLVHRRLLESVAIAIVVLLD